MQDRFEHKFVRVGDTYINLDNVTEILDFPGKTDGDHGWITVFFNGGSRDSFKGEQAVDMRTAIDLLLR